MPRVRTSRRVPPLRDSDIDHEIHLEDHAPADEVEQQLGSRPSSRATDESFEHGGDDAALVATDEALTSSESESVTPLREGAAPVSRDSNGRGNGLAHGDEDENNSVDRRKGASQPKNGEAGPSGPIARMPSSINGRPLKATPSRRSKHHRRSMREPETAIDVLYENERGGFLCGIPLFSSAALGNLDPPAWTNALHKPSPTDIKTAQVPDPSWEWVWPEWRINRDPGFDVDENGWEYSFMFSKKFSWHKPKWWNSFVRRRAWIRRRMKKGFGYEANDPHLMNREYFSVSSGDHFHRKSMSASSSVATGSVEGGNLRNSVVRPQQGAECQLHEEDRVDKNIDIETIEQLITLLRRSRIDREKLEAVQNYLEHATDHLLPLQDQMHEIMSLFVFQASRKLLLSRLTAIYDETNRLYEKDKDDGDGGDAGLRSRAENLAAAVKHADEEVRKLEYWSDVRHMAETGGSVGAVDSREGWREGWDGIDSSGAMGANREKLPSSSVKH